MYVGALKLTLHLMGAASLKEKRKVVRSILDRVKAKFNTAASEVGGQDLWQRIELGFAVCGNEPAFVEEQMEKIRHFVDYLGLAQLSDVRVEIINLGEMTWAPAAQDEWDT